MHCGVNVFTDHIEIKRSARTVTVIIEGNPVRLRNRTEVEAISRRKFRRSLLVFIERDACVSRNNLQCHGSGFLTLFGCIWNDRHVRAGFIFYGDITRIFRVGTQYTRVRLNGKCIIAPGIYCFIDEAVSFNFHRIRVSELRQLNGCYGDFAVAFVFYRNRDLFQTCVGGVISLRNRVGLRERLIIELSAV